jgi:hypothetical protein
MLSNHFAKVVSPVMKTRKTVKHIRNSPAALNNKMVPVSHPDSGIFLILKNVTLSTAI